MTLYQRKVPKYVAAQFNGTTESLRKIQDYFEVERYTITSEGFKTSIEMTVMVDGLFRKVTLGDREWIVLDEDSRLLFTMSESEFRKQFEVAK